MFLIANVSTILQLVVVEFVQPKMRTKSFSKFAVIFEVLYYFCIFMQFSIRRLQCEYLINKSIYLSIYLAHG